ncbi:MAG TPA: glycosyltransferase [Acetobacteraceae bacterium]|nr:glycosyltransferase [Acetobacteraceae bacterium]
MKILEISLFHPELIRGGAQQAAYELFLGLLQAGCDVALLASADLSGPGSLFKPGAVITGFDGRAKEFLFLSRAFDPVWMRNLDLRALKAFAAFLRDRAPDVVHFHHFLTFGLEFFLIARRTLPKARLFLTLHEFLAICRADGHMIRTFDKTLCTASSPVRCHQCFPDMAPELFRLREEWIKQALAVFDGFIAPTRFVRARYGSWGLEPQRIHVIPNAERDHAGLDSWKERASAEAGRVRARNRFGFFGQLLDVKGLDIVFEALAIFAKRCEEALIFEINGTNLTFASEKFRNRFEDFVAGRHGMPARIEIIDNGGYAVTDLPARMARIDWVLVPSIWGESFGLVLSEAFMFRRPPIASRIGGLAERVCHERDGLLFDPGDASALADSLHRAITQEGLWERLSAASPGAPSVESVVEAHLALFAGESGKAKRQAPHSPEISRRLRSSSSL